MNEPILLGYHREKNSRNDDNSNQFYNLYLKGTDNLKFTNVLSGIQIRSMAKHIMIKYFDYCDKNNIKIY
jgi:hypothetical protein